MLVGLEPGDDEGLELLRIACKSRHVGTPRRFRRRQDGTINYALLLDRLTEVAEVAAKLEVRFRPEHRFLVAINDRSLILGGIYYEIEEGGQTAHLEKIVVAESHRRKGVADRLMKELFNRLRTAGVKAITTGFFRPQFFYRYGFTVERRYAGLVRSLVRSDRR